MDNNKQINRKLFTSESVTEGHPDKLCDQISDAILDAALASDPESRVACEVLATTGLVLVAGEVTTETYIDIQQLVREVVDDIGYNRGKIGFDAENCAVLVSLESQSADIALGVNKALEAREGDTDEFSLIGAGDQGMMFGYACDETDSFMPLPIELAHRLAKRLAMVRKEGILEYLRPDGKTQVTVEYIDDVPVAVDTVVVACQHAPEVTLEQIRKDIITHVIYPTIPEELRKDNMIIHVNPTGRFVMGGPKADTGLTGRKIVVDTYGGYAPHGGGCFSGKDPTKVDRSATYMARYIAKNIVASKLASRCEVQLAYAIGVSEPVSVRVDTKGTGVLSDDKILEKVLAVFDMRPAAIIAQFDMKKPIYRQTAAYGHFGRDDLDLPWERTDKIDDLLK